MSNDAEVDVGFHQLGYNHERALYVAGVRWVQGVDFLFTSDPQTIMMRADLAATVKAYEDGEAMFVVVEGTKEAVYMPAGFRREGEASYWHMLSLSPLLSRGWVEQSWERVWKQYN